MSFGRTLVALGALLVGAPALAVPVLFTGEENSEGRPLGTLENDALASGLTILDIDVSGLDLLGDHSLSVTNDLTMNVGFGEVPVPFSATSDWSLSNDGAVAGNVHLVIAIAPKYSVSDIMGYLKGKLARRLFQRYEKLGRRYWGRHLWSRGYCVSTVGIDEEQIRKSVKWQEKREQEIEAIQGSLFD